ncbi:MAG: alpha/beta fold hydrolase [Nibricoccus sp.]
MSGCTSLARKMVLPGSFLKEPDNVVKASEDYELISLTTKGRTKIVAQFGKALDRNGRTLPTEQKPPTVIFFYGNRMSIAQSQDIFRDLRRMGVNVLIPDYPGYGMSGGRASEEGCYAAADAAYAYLLQRADVDRRRLVIAGMSVGCGVAVDLACREEATALLLVVPFPNIRSVGKDNLPWYLRWGVPVIARRAAFDSRAKVARVYCPIFLVQAKNDHVTSAKRTDELIAAMVSKMDRVIVDADHDGSWAKGRAEIETWLKQW